MPSRKSPKGPRPVEAIKHPDKRVNIPTEELREFVRAEEESPTSLLYPRDPSEINHHGDEILKVFEVSGAGTLTQVAKGAE